jgi:DNA-binding GntR family transcriptional regulator
MSRDAAERLVAPRIDAQPDVEPLVDAGPAPSGGAASGPLPSGSSGRLADDVYRTLRADIVMGRLRPRDHLVEVDLAQRLKVSRTPIRESLQRLAADGLIVSHRRRWVVYEHTLEEIKDIYEVRMALEGYAARLACQRATAEQVARLQAFFAGRPRGPVRGNPGFVDFNTAFHELITEAANNGYFQRLAESGRFYSFNNQLAQRYDGGDVEESNAQHRAILDAIVARDPDAAERAARAHVEFSLQLIVARQA